MSRHPVALSLLLLLALGQQGACASSEDENPEDSNSEPSDSKDSQDATPDPSEESQGTESGSTSETTGSKDQGDSSEGSSESTQDSSSSEEPTGDPEQVQEVCKRWKSAFGDKDEGQWSGSVSDCKAGDIDAGGRKRALDRINFIRWLSKLKAVKTDPAWDKKAQECALMMHANGFLTHNPPKSWKCYTDDGALAARSSNISSTPGVMSVLLYMIDPGNATTIGHRRWILSNRFGPTGLGSTSKSSCMYTMGGQSNGNLKWAAWPPPGVFPIELNANSWSSMDDTGWTIQSDSISFSGKKIRVQGDGKELDVSTADLLPNFGARNAVKITPKGWKMKSGVRYQVQVEGTEIDYAFRVTSCK